MDYHQNIKMIFQKVTNQSKTKLHNIQTPSFLTFFKFQGHHEMVHWVRETKCFFFCCQVGLASFYNLTWLCKEENIQ